MNRNIAILGGILGAALVAYAAFFYVPKAVEEPPGGEAAGGETEWASDRTPTNFSHEGTLSVPTVASGQATMTFRYKEAEGNEASKVLLLDPLSICASSTGAAPCLSMSVTFDKPFDGKRAVVEGVRADDGVVLRKLRVLGENDFAIVPGGGQVFIPWQEAVDLINNCEVKMAMQTHALDVFITLKDNTVLRAVEPVIDRVFEVVHAAPERCGNIGLATE